MCPRIWTGNMAADESTSERTAVRTYVPQSQRKIWDEHADELDMSRSEFVRTMVQAGRRGFDPRSYASKPPTDEVPEMAGSESAETNGESMTDTRSNDLDDRILELLDGTKYLSWDDLFDALTDDIEQRLDESLQRLQSNNEIQHSGRHGGYVKIE